MARANRSRPLNVRRLRHDSIPQPGVPPHTIDHLCARDDRLNATTAGRLPSMRRSMARRFTGNVLHRKSHRGSAGVTMTARVDSSGARGRFEAPLAATAPKSIAEHLLARRHTRPRRPFKPE